MHSGSETGREGPGWGVGGREAEEGSGKGGDLWRHAVNFWRTKQSQLKMIPPWPLQTSFNSRKQRSCPIDPTLGYCQACAPARHHPPT
eukprot:54081-Rhodomonas_salina.1